MRWELREKFDCRQGALRTLKPPRYLNREFKMDNCEPSFREVQRQKGDNEVSQRKYTRKQLPLLGMRQAGGITRFEKLGGGVLWNWHHTWEEGGCRLELASPRGVARLFLRM